MGCALVIIPGLEECYSVLAHEVHDAMFPGQAVVINMNTLTDLYRDCL